MVAAANAMSNVLHIKAVLNDINFCPDLQLTVDSTTLDCLSTSITELQERLNKIDLTAIGEAFQEDELGAVHWCAEQKLLVESLTKDDKLTPKLLHTALVTGLQGRPDERRTNLGLRTFNAIQVLLSNLLRFGWDASEGGGSEIVLRCSF